VLHEDGVKWPAMRFSISTSNYVCCISIHPDSKKVAAGMADGVAMVVSVSMGSMGETLFYLPGHMATVRAIAYSPSGKRIATGALSERFCFAMC
jgi:WD40 repeat protein